MKERDILREGKKKNRSKLIKAALQLIPCDLTVENVQYVNLFTGEIYRACIDVLDGIVVRVRVDGKEDQTKSKMVYDGKGRYLIPGYIDTHMHVESTMMIPENFSRAAVPWGTTTICTDPHEIGNVMGIEGVRFMLENSRKSQLRQYVLAPSCVPAVPGLENSGAAFNAKEIGDILDMKDVIGIAEIMDYVGVIKDDARMHEIIEQGIQRKVFLQGHAPLLSGKELAAYRLGGPCSDHESSSARELKEKLRMGIRINLRASSIVNQLKDLAEGLKDISWYDYVSICTDDVHAKDLLKEGHINRVVGKAIEEGLPALEVIRMATLNAAREYGFEDLGAIAPGYLADMQLVEALDGGSPSAVFIEGKLVAENGVYLGDDGEEGEKDFINTVHLDWIKSADDFKLIAPTKQLEYIMTNVVVPIDEGNILRKVEIQTLPIVDGYVNIDEREDLQFVCVCNRHGDNHKTIAIMQGFGLKKGAFGTTISHDSHNLIIVYRKPEDAFAVTRELEKNGGGLCTVKDEQVMYCMELPVAGLMSQKCCSIVSDELERLEESIYQICDHNVSILTCSIMSLTALSGVIITDCGLVDGEAQDFIPLFPDN